MILKIDLYMHLALFSNCNPTKFEVDAKEVKWQKAMDEKIAFI